MSCVTCHLPSVTCPVDNRPSTSLDKKSQIVGWLVTHGGKWRVYTKKRFCQNFRIFKKKFTEGSAYLVYNGIYKILQNLHFGHKNTFVWAHMSPTYWVGPNLTSLFYEKKSVWSITFLLILNFRFLSLKWSSIVMAKILNLKLIFFSLSNLFFSHKTYWFSLVLLYMWVTYGRFHRGQEMTTSEIFFCCEDS